MFNRFNDEVNFDRILCELEADELLNEDNIVHSLDPLETAEPIGTVFLEMEPRQGAGARWCRQEMPCTVMST